jgi:glycine cleavage system H protein
MAQIQEDVLYSKNYEWVKEEKGKAKIGLSDHAQRSLGEIIYVELPKPGEEIEKGDELSIVESVKTVQEIHSPVSGKVTRVNNALEDSPDLINKSPYEHGWLVELKLSSLDELKELFTPEKYRATLR